MTHSYDKDLTMTSSHPVSRKIMDIPRVISHFFQGFKGLGDSRRIAIIIKEGSKFDYLVPLARPLRIRKVLKVDRKYWEFSLSHKEENLLEDTIKAMQSFAKDQEDISEPIRVLLEYNCTSTLSIHPL